MILSILATIVLLALGAVAKLLTHDWFHPAPSFCVLWGSICGVAIAVAPENITSATGPLWILLNAALVVAGGVAGTAFACSTHHRRLALKTSNDRNSQPFSQVALRRATALCIALGFAYIVLLLHSQGIGVGQLLNLRGLAAAAMKMSFSRYSKASQGAGIYLQLLLCISYLAPLLGGTLFVLRKRRLDKALALLSLAAQPAGILHSVHAFVRHLWGLHVGGRISEHAVISETASTANQPEGNRLGEHSAFPQVCSSSPSEMFCEEGARGLGA